MKMTWHVENFCLTWQKVRTDSIYGGNEINKIKGGLDDKLLVLETNKRSVTYC